MKIKRIFQKFGCRYKPKGLKRSREAEILAKQIDALYGILGSIYGSERLILKAGKLEALHLVRSECIQERVLGLQRIIMEDPTIDKLPRVSEIQSILSDLEERIADLLARKNVEQSIEKKVAEKMQERHDEYLKELRMQILQEEQGPDNPQTLKRYAELERLERRRLSSSASERLRPRSVDEVVGQERAIKALFAKIVSPFPQHVILYGPPGVGKTTVARLALETAKKMKHTPFDEEAKFVEVDGSTLRWDPREVTNPLLGSVHDPIYQGAKRDLAEGAVPEPKLGLVTEAHGGVLFIDEIGEMDPILQTKLLKVLEDKRVYFDSAYYDPTDPNVPKYIRKLFEEGAPADFILIGATTRSPEEINPALRSRCAEVFFEPLSKEDIEKIVVNAAKRINARLEPGVAELIADLTLEGRKATGILADCYGFALHAAAKANGEQVDGEALEVTITTEMVKEVARVSRLTPHTIVRASSTPEVGKIFGLGVSGFVGSVLEIEAVAFPGKTSGKGTIRFNETAGSMAKDSVFNAASVVRLLTGIELSDYDIHINVIGGGRIDGPSAGVAIVLAILSALRERPIRQDVAVTGEVSIQGKVKAVGGIQEKIYGAIRSNMRKVIIPKDNLDDVPSGLKDIEIVPIERIEEAFSHIFAAAADTKASRTAIYPERKPLIGAV